MSAAYPLLAAQVVIEAGVNDALVVRENAANETLTISPGSYVLRGDDTDPGDLCAAIKDCLDSHSGGNTYGVSAAWSIAPGSPCATVTITRASGANSFAVYFGDASTTFPAAYLGFVSSNTSYGAADKVSTLTPSCAWCGSDVISAIDQRTAIIAATRRARSGRIVPVKRGGPIHALDLSLSLQEERRVHADRIIADPSRALSDFVGRWAAGAMELHLATLASGTTLDDPSTSTRRESPSQYDLWHIDADSVNPIRARRIEPGVPLYDVELSLLESIQ